MTQVSDNCSFYSLPATDTPTPICRQPTPQVAQQRPLAASTSPSHTPDSHKSMMRQQRETDPLHLTQDPFWWQHYYQLYHYHPPPGRKPAVFGPYLLLQTLGEGEFGKVKLGIHIETGHEVAIKLMKKDSITSSARMTKVEREISVLRTVRHPYIVKLYDVMETDKYIGIILQCASGGELFDHILAHRYLKEKDASRLFAQLISGVHYMHQKKIIHRDLKLENLLLDRYRNIIITDFGFANQFSSSRDDLMSTSCGSPCYAAPELVVSDGMYAGSAVDIWSCGVILYAMLCGYLPFDDDPANPDSENINLLYKYILNTPLAFPDSISDHARDLLRKILVPDPSKRCNIETIMNHPWLAMHKSLFKKSLKELEFDAMNSSDIPFYTTISSSRRSMDRSRRTTNSSQTATTTTTTYTPKELVGPLSPKPKDVPKSSTQDIAVPVSTSSAESGADKSIVSEASTLVPAPNLSSVVTMPEQAPSTPRSSIEPDKGRGGENRRPATVNLPHSPLPSPSRTTDRIFSFFGSSSLHRQQQQQQQQQNGKPRPFSTSAAHASTVKPARTVSTQRQPHSILQSKFLTSLQRHSGDSRPRSTPADGPVPNVSMSTPQGAPISSFAASSTRATPPGPLPPRKTRPNTVHQPKPLVGTSQPVRGTRRKTLSLLIHSVADYIADDGRRANQPPTPKTALPTTGRHTQPPHVVVREPSPIVEDPVIPEPSMSEQRMPAKHGTSRKLFGWFRSNEPQARERPAGKPLQGHVPIRAMPIGKPLGSYAVDFNDTKLRIHHGAVDQDALTSRAPLEVFAQVKETLMSMGIEVKGDGEYKIKCTRRKQPSSLVASNPGRKMMAHPNASIRMLLRRPPRSPSANSEPVSPKPATLYGDSSVDPGDEIRFSVEMCKIKNLPGLYIVDIRRMRGNVWSYKYLYHAILGHLNLNGEGGYLTATSPLSSSKDYHSLRTLPTACDSCNNSNHRMSIVSSGDSSSMMEEN